MKLVLLAAGFATRMYPLTRERAKPLLEVGGKPILTRILERVLALGEIDEVVVITNARFHADFLAWRDALDGRVPIEVVNDGARSDDDKLGAIADMALAIDHLSAEDETLVVAGDNLMELDLARHVATLRAERAPVIVRRTVAGEVPPRRYGEVEVDSEERVVRFREKPADPRSDQVSTGIYLFPAGIRAHLAEYLESGGNPDAPGHFVQWLVERGPVYALPFEGRWFDIGSLETLEEARRAFR